jgi:hypothetical protein
LIMPDGGSGGPAAVCRYFERVSGSIR